MSDLIPGLPEEVARECLVRVGFDQLPVVRRISRQWKWEVESPYYSRLRRAGGLARPMIALVQAQPKALADGDAGPAHKTSSAAATAGTGGLADSYRMVLLDPVDGRWTPLPTLPGPMETLPVFCQVAATDNGQGRKHLVVLGGWHPTAWAPITSVFVYDFRTGAWRLGAPMPGPRRSFPACAAVGGLVYVAGGHDEEKNALRTALAYDPEADTWTSLPDMATERDEARGLCVEGKFLAVGGYPTQAQGRFVGSAEAFDPATWEWGPVQEGLLPDGACPKSCCVVPGTDRLYMLRDRDGHLLARDGAAWQTVAQVPEDARTAAAVSALPDGSVVVIGAGCHGGEHTVCVLREEAGKAAAWERAPTPPEFSGHVMASSFLEI